MTENLKKIAVNPNLTLHQQGRSEIRVENLLGEREISAVQSSWAYRVKLWSFLETKVKERPKYETLC